MKTYTSLLIILFAIFSGQAFAQGTLADYRRAEAVDSLYRNRIYNNPVAFNWMPDGNVFWYRNNGKLGKEYIWVDVNSLRQHVAFDHERLAQTLSQSLGKKISAADLPINNVEFVKDKTSIEFMLDSANWRCDLQTYACQKKEIVKDEKRPFRYWGTSMNELENKPVVSPDSLWTAFIRNHNAYIRSIKSQNEFQLSFDGVEENYYSSYMQWSPDSKKLMAYRVRPTEKHFIYFVESSPNDQLQPKLCSREYLKPGDALPHKVPQLFLIDEKKHVAITDELFNQQFSISNIAWRKDSRAFTFEYNERGHQVYRIIEVNSTGAVNVVVEEGSRTFIDYSSKKYRYDVEDGKEIIWASERDGWNHLYRYDGINRKVKNQITKGSWVIRKVIHIDEKRKHIIFAASGLDKDQDPYLMHYCRVNFDGSGFKRLTVANANHNAIFSPDFKYFVDQYSRVDMPTITVLCRAEDGKELMQLQRADIQELQQAGWKMPEVFSSKGRDGKTDIWGIIIRPSHFDAAKKYPVIEYIYAGPHGSFVPKSFHAGNIGLHAVAELGFIVIQIDGMGTSNRSKSFHDVCWKNLKDAGFPDRIAWMREVATKYSYFDTSRVGIYGSSAGGQSSTGALLFYPEFYKVGVSSCGCHDNRMDKIWWNEQMDGISHWSSLCSIFKCGKCFQATRQVNAYRW